MTLVDLLIVYLACGAPFAVYQATTRETGPRAVRAVRIVFALFFWPILAFILIKHRLARVSRGQDASELEKIRSEIEARLFPDGSSSNVFEFRDAFYRCAGLEQAGLEKPSKTSFEVFKVSGHPNPLLASRILARTNLRKIDDHKIRAQDEFADVLSRNFPTDIDIEFRESIARFSPSIQLSEHSEIPVLAESRPTARV